ncbi:MAG: phage portal protein [Lentisphaeria bacterium]
MFDGFKSFLRQVVGKMTGWGNIRKAMAQGSGSGITAAISEQMENAMEQWSKMYSNNADWLSDNCSSLNLPATIASELARLVTLEAEVCVSGSARGEYINEQMQPVYDNLRRYTEYACALGGVIFKPYISEGEIVVECVSPDSFLPTAFNSRGNITGAVFSDRIYRGQLWYTKLERHGFDGGKYHVTNRAYVSDQKSQLGREIALDAVPEWADLEPESWIDGLNRPLFSYFRIPNANQIDNSSPLGVSVFSRAADLIKEADKQYSRILWEYEGSELAVDASMDLFQRAKDGKLIFPKGKDRLFRALDTDMGVDGGVQKSLQTFSPAIRDESLYNGLEQLLRRIEYNCGMSYGTLSKIEDTDKTATEIRSSKQRLYATVTDIQKSLEAALTDLAECMDLLCTLYSLSPSGSWELSAKWDDSIVVDSDTERLRDKEDVRDGIMQPWEFRAKWYGEDEATAKAMVGAQRTDDEYMGFGGGGDA